VRLIDKIADLVSGKSLLLMLIERVLFGLKVQDIPFKLFALVTAIVRSELLSSLGNTGET